MRTRRVGLPGAARGASLRMIARVSAASAINTGGCRFTGYKRKTCKHSRVRCLTSGRGSGRRARVRAYGPVG